MAFARKRLFGLHAILESVKNALLPSGAIVWFKRTTAPDGWVVCDGTNGTPNLIGRYPLGATSGIGDTVEAGLPDITGTAWGYEIGKAGGWRTTGCFYDAGAGNQKGTSDNNDTCGKLGFKASRSSSVYGKSSTVTPPSVKLLPCMKL